MAMRQTKSFPERLKEVIIGRAHSLRDRSTFRKLSLIAFFAWVGLGADGLSSSCYGPEEAFLALQKHHYLGVFVALASAFTVIVISSSYSQIIEVFPSGGGGYLVASKLLAPPVGMVAGCALLVDYVLTVSLSVASGTEALLSFFPASMLALKVPLSVAAVVALVLMNLRGVKESVVPLVPVFGAFVVAHAVAIGYALGAHAWRLPAVAEATAADVSETVAKLAPGLVKKFPQSVVFVGQLVLPQESLVTRWLHNNISLTVQHRLAGLGVPFVMLPVRTNPP